MYTTGMRFVIPEVVVSHFHLRLGDQVADFGAGSGFFLAALSEAVGPTGRVYACDIQKNLVEKMGALVQSRGLQNVDTLWGDIEVAHKTKIPTGELDAALLVNTLFQIEATPIAVSELGRTLRSGGKLFIIDWTDTVPGLGPAPDKLITADDCIVLFESNGFILEREFPAGEHHYGLAFRKI